MSNHCRLAWLSLVLPRDQMSQQQLGESVPSILSLLRHALILDVALEGYHEELLKILLPLT